MEQCHSFGAKMNWKRLCWQPLKKIIGQIFYYKQLNVDQLFKAGLKKLGNISGK